MSVGLFRGSLAIISSVSCIKTAMIQNDNEDMLHLAYDGYFQIYSSLLLFYHLEYSLFLRYINVTPHNRKMALT